MQSAAMQVASPSLSGVLAWDAFLGAKSESGGDVEA